MISLITHAHYLNYASACHGFLVSGYRFVVNFEIFLLRIYCFDSVHVLTLLTSLVDFAKILKRAKGDRHRTLNLLRGFKYWLHVSIT